MNKDDMILISVDDHIVEPPDMFKNHLRWYSFEPFGHMSREQATVGALRQAAEGHDVSIHALSRHQTGERAANALAEATKFNS